MYYLAPRQKACPGCQGLGADPAAPTPAPSGFGWGALITSFVAGALLWPFVSAPLKELAHVGSSKATKAIGKHR